MPCERSCQAGHASRKRHTIAALATQLALLERLFHAFNTRDLNALAQCFHPDADIRPSQPYVPPGTGYHGREGLRSMLTEALPRLGDVRGDLVATHEFPACVVAEVRVQLDGTARDSIWLYTFRDGLVARAEEYPRLEAALAAAERPRLLTAREAEIFELLARGLSGAQIAERLVLSPETVRTHVQNGVERLGARTRVQAVAMALSRGEIELPANGE